MKFTNKVVVVTGSSRGIGKATALAFGEAGAKVVVHYHKEKSKAEAVAKAIGPENSLVVQADLTDEQQVKTMVKKAMARFGQIDILVNNAGAILRPGDWQSDFKTWRKTIDTNLTSAWLMIKYIAPIMQKQKQGSIVNLVSTVGILGTPYVAPYGAAKGGLITLTKAMAKALAPDIRVNGVAPSNVMTDMTKGAGKDLIEKFRLMTPLLRIAEPEELAKPILFLASDEASYITGEILVVDGGYSLK
jgi:3-oxoacyl-[acyl-carrier protein] reductase